MWKKKILWRCVRTLSAAPNRDYKGRLSVLSLLPETFRLPTRPRDQRTRGTPRLRPSARPGEKASATERRDHKGPPCPPLSCICQWSALAAIGFAFHRLYLSHPGDLRQQSLAAPPAQEVKQAPSKAATSQTELGRKMKLPIFIADAFTATAFRGNPAAVCLLENTLDDDSHQLIAREMNLSETAFIRKLQPTDNFTQSSHFGLRWFTPESEFPLCGHATLASAAVLFHKIKNTNNTLTFATMSGELKARRAEDGIVLDFPLYPAFPQDFHEVEDLIKAAIGDTLVQDIRYSPDTKNLMVRLSDSYDRSFLETLRVNTEPLPRMEKTGKVKGLILTLRGEPGGQTPHYDFYSRYFAPWVGVAEDPVTGSAHTILGPYWSEELGKKDMRAFQCSRRGGELDISLRPDGRVDLKGGAAIVLEGTLTV